VHGRCSYLEQSQDVGLLLPLHEGLLQLHVALGQQNALRALVLHVGILAEMVLHGLLGILKRHVHIIQDQHTRKFLQNRPILQTGNDSDNVKKKQSIEIKIYKIYLYRTKVAVLLLYPAAVPVALIN
jgi:hypothetical protein